jgi:hypothetical protein
MRARKKRVKDYEKFGQFVTMPSLKKLDGCLGAHFIRIFEARKPEYLWVVFWRDQKALEAARTNPLWRDQKKKFEAGQFYKTIPLELICESLDSFGALKAGTEKPKNSANAEKPAKPKATKRKANKPEGERPDVDAAPAAEAGATPA